MRAVTLSVWNLARAAALMCAGSAVVALVRTEWTVLIFLLCAAWVLRLLGRVAENHDASTVAGCKLVIRDPAEMPAWARQWRAERPMSLWWKVTFVATGALVAWYAGNARARWTGGLGALVIVLVAVLEKMDEREKAVSLWHHVTLWQRERDPSEGGGVDHT